MLESFSLITRGGDLGPGISALHKHFVELIGGLSSAWEAAGDSNDSDGRVRHIVTVARESVGDVNELFGALSNGLVAPEEVSKGYIENL